MQRFTLGNFNVRNLVPASDEAHYHFFYGRQRRNSYWNGGAGAENTYREKIDWIAGQLAQMGADVVCFEEIFDEKPLLDVVAATRHAGQAQIFIAGEAKTQQTDYQGVPATVHHIPRTALMVSGGFEMLSFESLSHFPPGFDFSRSVEEDSGRVWRVDLQEGGESLQRFNRPLLKATLRLPPRFRGAKGVPQGELPEVTIFAAHLKSKRPIQNETNVDDPRLATAAFLKEQALGKTRALLLRALEAAALRAYVLDELVKHPDRPVIVMGDLNDGPRSVTTEVAGGLTQPVIGSGVSRDDDKREQMIDMLADLSLYSAYDLQTGRIHRDVYYTHIFDGFHDTLDHVLLSSHFVPKWQREGRGRANVGKVGTLRVFNDHLVNADVDDIKSHAVGKYLHTRSDHGQITVRLDWFI